MSIAEPSEPTGVQPPALSLAARRPGHAAMKYVLDELARRGLEASSKTSMPSDLHSWQIGISGEQIVGQELALLPEGWRVLHAVPAGAQGADIDHLVIGPGGVFVLNTKHHAGRTIKVGTHVVWINGYQQSGYQRELLKRRDQVNRVLRLRDTDLPAVYSMLVFVRPKQILLQGDQAVFSLASSALITWLLARPRVLSAEAVVEIAQRASEPSTWGAPASAALEADPTAVFLTLPELATVAAPASRPRRPASERTSVALRRGVGRRIAVLVAALGLTLLVLPAVVAVILMALGAYLRFLTGA